MSTIRYVCLNHSISKCICRFLQNSMETSKWMYSCEPVKWLCSFLDLELNEFNIIFAEWLMIYLIKLISMFYKYIIVALLIADLNLYDKALACNEYELARLCSNMGEDYYPNCDLETCDECQRVCKDYIYWLSCFFNKS